MNVLIKAAWMGFEYGEMIKVMTEISEYELSNLLPTTDEIEKEMNCAKINKSTKMIH